MGVLPRPGCQAGCCRGRALGRQAPTAGPGRVGERCWLRAGGVGPGTEAPALAEVEGIRRQQRDRLLQLNPRAAAAGTQALTARQQSCSGLAVTGMGMVTGVRPGLRRPRRLTVFAIAGEAPAVVFNVLRVARAVQRRRPRMVAGSVLVVAGSPAAWQHRLNRSGNSRPAAATAATEHRETARRLPAKPFMRPPAA